MAIVAALPSILGTISSAAASLYPAASGLMSLYGGFSQSRSLKQQGNATEDLYNYNAKVVENQAQQQLYTAEANAAIAMRDRQKEANELGMTLNEAKRKFDYDQASVTTSLAARGIDLSNPTAIDILNDQTVSYEREVQKEEYVSGQKQANSSQEAVLQQYYGNVAASEGRVKAAQLRVEGSSLKASYYSKAASALRTGIVSAASSFSSYFKVPSQTPLSSPGLNLDASLTPSAKLGLKPAIFLDSNQALT